MSGGVDARTLAAEIDRVQVVDVRTSHEWDAGHIAGARHIPEDDVVARAGELDADRAVVTVCHTGSRSATAAADLTAAGLVAESLVGGMEAWAAAGLAVITDGGGPGTVVPAPPASEEHQRFAADFMAAALAVQEHFGNREPSEEEVLDFLRRRDRPS